MKIAFFEVREKEKQLLSAQSAGLIGLGYELLFYDEKLSLDNVGKVKEADIVSVFINSEVKKDAIDALPNLKLITTRSTGFDHVDVKYAGIKGIKVSSVPAYGSRTVAEFAFGLMLNLSRNICRASAQVREKGDHNIAGFEGFDLFGKTLGVVGTGRIGKNVVCIAKGFGMNVIITDMYPDNKFAEEQGLKYVSLEELLRQSDIVTLHTPYNESTHHLINAENIQFMKRGAYIVNTARGEIIDTVSLSAALKSGQLAGAGLDVLEEERKSKEGKDEELLKMNLELIAMPNVIVTPHIAFFSAEAEAEIIKTTIENISTFVEGHPQNIIEVNPPAGGK